MTRQKRTRVGGPPCLTVKDKRGHDKLLVDDSYTRILGCNISNNLDWSAHLITGEKALLPRLRQKIGALKILFRYFPFKSKLLLAN